MPRFSIMGKPLTPLNSITPGQSAVGSGGGGIYSSIVAQDSQLAPTAFVCMCIHKCKSQCNHRPIMSLGRT